MTLLKKDREIYREIWIEKFIGFIVKLQTNHNTIYLSIKISLERTTHKYNKGLK